jgi:hypothetical protein
MIGAYLIIGRFRPRSSVPLSLENKANIILTNGAPLAYEVNFIKVERISDNHL